MKCLSIRLVCCASLLYLCTGCGEEERRRMTEQRANWAAAQKKVCLDAGLIAVPKMYYDGEIYSYECQQQYIPPQGGR